MNARVNSKPVIRRLIDGPVITSAMDARLGDNLNGPSPIAAPPWIENPPGRVYLYFAHHRGRFIRLAFADAIEGPWRVHGPGCLDVVDSLFEAADIGTPEEMARNYTYAHVASPDVHVLEEERQVRLYYHGLMPDGSQKTRVAVSENGINFQPLPDVLGGPYFRVFPHDGAWYALEMRDRVLRSENGLTDFRPVGALGDTAIRHSAVLVRGDRLHVFFSRIGDTPEHILHGVVNLAQPADAWRLQDVTSVLNPEMGWEGAGLPVTPSAVGEVIGPVHQLRDPGLLEWDGRLYLFYAAAGENAIGMVEVRNIAG